MSDSFFFTSFSVNESQFPIKKGLSASQFRSCVISFLIDYRTFPLYCEKMLYRHHDGNLIMELDAFNLCLAAQFIQNSLRAVLIKFLMIFV